MLALLPSTAGAQQQSNTIQISRNYHDAAWMAAGTAVTMTLREVGLEPRAAGMIGGPGLATAVKLIECSQWCGRPNVTWPASVALKDAVYDITLASASVPLLIGKRKGWKAGVGAGLLWIGAVALMRQAKWNSP